MNSDLLYQIALKKLSGIGSSRAKRLISYCGGVREVFDATKRKLASVPSIGEGVIGALNMDEALKAAEAEVKFIEKQGLKPIFFLDKEYPRRLKHCEDGPILIYTDGRMDLNNSKVVSIVGTRSATEYGRRNTEKLIEGLRKHNVLVVSGLALGIDIIAHRAAVQAGLETVGVLGHSLDRIYPSQNKSIADKMKLNGGLISEFESGTKPDRENFPQRNRIVAGMSDVCIVVETAVRGGSMITARLASDYNRDVMAFPGPVDAIFSSGCNHLIKTNQANLIETIEDLEYLMGWQLDVDSKKTTQTQLFVELNKEEQMLFDLIKPAEKESLDNLSVTSGFPVSKTSTILLEMEFKGVIKTYPGKMYARV